MKAAAVTRLPPTSYVVTSSVFHYLGPALAVLLFVHVDVLGVAWLRVASAAVVFAVWRRPWRRLRTASRAQRRLVLHLGLVLGAMNCLFYLAVDRLPLATVGAIEFVGIVVVAAAGSRTRRNVVALALAVGGVACLTSLRLSGEVLGFAFAFANCLGFALYLVLAHRAASTTSPRPDDPDAWLEGIDRLGLSMIVAAVVVTPVGIVGAGPAFTHPTWLLWGVGVGLCSSVVPYVADQLAMVRMRRATFALTLALLPASATVIGLVVLTQVPGVSDIVGIALVVVGVALHHEQAHEARDDALTTV